MIAAGRTSLLQAATTMTGGKRRVRERIKLIARRPKTVLAVALAAALLLALAVGCAFSGAPEEAKTLDNLQQRLEDIPEELRDRVRFDLTDEEPGHLADYWFNVPAEWTEDFQPWLLSVRQLSQEELNQTAGSFALNHAPEPFAKSGSQYYALHWSVAIEYAPDDKEQFNAAFEAIRDFAMQTVLETEGVEPYNSSQPLDTLQTRLLDVPAELRDNVEARADDGALVNYFFKKPGKALDEAQYLLYVERISQEQLDQRYDGSSTVANGSHPFAQGNGQYYVLHWNTSIEYDLEDEEAFNAAYQAVRDFAMQTVLETDGVEPFDLYQLDRYQISAVVNRLLAAPSIELSLAPAGTSRIYAYPIDPSQHSNSLDLSALASNFRWEKAPYSTMDGATTLRLEASDGSASLFLSEGSYLVLDGDGNCWKGVYNVENYVATADTTPFDYLRRLVFDVAELDALRSTTVPNRDQSHEDIVREWAENWEGAGTKTAPGSQYACTYVRIENVNANLPEFESRDALEEFVRNRNLAFTADDFGKIWFCFSYDTVFVPADQSEDGPMWAGNTRYYEGDGAPEGALVYSHVGYMWLTDEGWTCTGVGTGL